MKKLIYLIGAWLAALGSVQAQIELIQDLNPGTIDRVIPASAEGGLALTPLGDHLLFFLSNHPTYGQELWKMNANEEITLVKDIFPGITDGVISYTMPVYNGKAYFTGADREGVFNLYQTDGSDEGTIVVKTLYTGELEEHRLRESLILNGKLLFQIGISEGEDHVWITDGTAAGTSLLSTSIFLDEAAIIGNKALLVGTDEVHRYELWETDGTVAGTRLLKDIYPGTNDSDPEYMTALNGVVYFSAYTDDDGEELWKSDGTPEGTVMVKDIHPGPSGSYPQQLTVFEGKIYFSAVGSNTEGQELWVTDGTSGGTQMVKDIWPLNNHSNPQLFFVHNGELFFTAQADGTGFELFKTDGTSMGTVLVKDINTMGVSAQSYPENHFVLNNVHYFSAVDGIKTGLWKTDGTEGGTVLITHLGETTNSQNLIDVTTLNNKAYFALSQEAQLYRTDGTAEGTIKLQHSVEVGNDSKPKNFTPTSTGIFFNGVSEDGEVGNLYFINGASITNVNEAGMLVSNDTGDGRTALEGQFANGKLFFKAFTDEENDDDELWTSDGTLAGTHMVKDINPDGPSYPNWLFSFNDKVYFSAQNNSSSNYELWVTDGTEGGTTLVKEINPGASGSNPSQFYAFGDEFIFKAHSDANGFELWKSDGTTGGTVMVKDLYTGTAAGVDNVYGVFGNKIFIRGTAGGPEGRELWTSDGTADGFELLGDFNPGLSTGQFREQAFTEIGNKVLFVTEGKIWSTDGTSAGTSIIENEEIDGYYFEAKVGVMNDKMIFVAYHGLDEDGNYIINLYSTDGTNAGTGILMADIVIDHDNVDSYDGAYFYNATESGGKLYFTLGRGIFTTNGTASGTTYIATDKDDEKLYAKYPVFANGKLYFTGRQSNDGTTTIFQSDGTQAGTFPIDNGGVDIRRNLYVIDDYLYFAGFSIDIGEEPYRFNASKQVQFISFPAIDDQVASTALTLNATASSGLPVSFEIVDGPAIVSGNSLTFSGEGTVVVKAKQPGNSTYHPATSVVQSFDVAKAEQTITFSPIENKFLEAGSFTLVASASSGLSLTFEVVTGAVSIEGNTLTMTAVGDVTLRATQSGNEIYLPAAPAEQSFKIGLVTGLPEKMVSGIQAYPNPVLNSITVKPHGKNNQLNFTDLNGRSMMILQSDTDEALDIDLSAWPAGFYILQVANEIGIRQMKILKK